MKKYPYTIISSKQFLLFHNSLIQFGYEPRFLIEDYLEGNRILSATVVINDIGKFGLFCFYPSPDYLDPDEKRIFIKDPYRFLKHAAKYKNHNKL